tara:strand:- start:1157 stop:1921 length:765 start_codon:yes stop_codon:yes gene_type:complete
MELKNIVKSDFKHSFSSVNKFKHNPSEWLVHYGLGLKVSSSPAMVRGNLAEFGAYYKIKRGMQQKDDKYFTKLLSHKFSKYKFFNAESELYNSIDIAKKFEEKLYERQLRNIVSYQKEKVEKVKGLEHPVRLFTDFEYDNLIVDLKSTLRLPTKPKIDHVRQQALYSKLHDKPIALLYATPKKTLWYDLTKQDVKNGYDELVRDFKSLENFIDMCDNDIEKAIKITPLNTDPSPFYWDSNIKQAATKVWKSINK